MVSFWSLQDDWSLFDSAAKADDHKHACCGCSWYGCNECKETSMLTEGFLGFVTSSKVNEDQREQARAAVSTVPPKVWQ